MPRYAGITCNDGFSMSIQASREHYSSPRADVGPYTEVEVGFPSSLEEALMPYQEGPGWYYEDPVTGEDKEYTEEEYAKVCRDKAPQCVYGWVPADVVIEVIGKHGGIKEGTMPPLIAVPMSKD